MKTNKSINSRGGGARRIAAAVGGLALVLAAVAVIYISARLADQIPYGSPASAVYQQDWPANMSVPDLRCLAVN